MQPSKFVHSFPVGDDITGLYHSLKVKTVFVSDKIAHQFRHGDLTDDWMLNAGFLVSAPEDDQQEIESIRQRLLSRSPAVAVMYLLLTDKCNLACDYCFIENQLPVEQPRNLMRQETAKAAIEFFTKAVQNHPESWNQRKSIIFYGGEPLLNKSVFKYAVKHISELKGKGELPESTRLSVITNGTCLTDDVLTVIETYGVNVAVSLDGDKEATDLHRHTTRGRPVFDKAFANIKRMQDAGIKVGVSCTINEETLRDPEHTIDFLLNEVGTKAIGFNILYRGHAISLGDQYEEKAAQFILHAFERFRKEGVYENRIMRKIDAFCEQRLYPYDCAAGGGRQIVVPPDGDVGICHGYVGSRNHFVGSVFDSSLEVEKTEIYDLWKRRTPLNMPECEDCPVLGICGGGCPCDAENSRGSIWDLDERFCVHAKATLKWLVSDLWKHSKPVRRAS